MIVLAAILDAASLVSYGSSEFVTDWVVRGRGQGSLSSFKDLRYESRRTQASKVGPHTNKESLAANRQNLTSEKRRNSLWIMMHTSKLVLGMLQYDWTEWELPNECCGRSVAGLNNLAACVIRPADVMLCNSTAESIDFRMVERVCVNNTTSALAYRDEGKNRFEDRVSMVARLNQKP